MRATLRGYWLRFGDEVDAGVSERVTALTRALLTDPPRGLTDIVPGYNSIYLEYDAEQITENEVRNRVRQLQELPAAKGGKSIRIPVRYDGPDLEEVASQAGLSTAEVIRRHTAPTYRVHALGFTPGFPFLGEVDPLLRVPRLEIPRAVVPAHSVGIADAQTGIYPLASPGGWRLLGTALEPVYDPLRPKPFLLEPGDRVKFEEAVGPDPAPLNPLELLPAEPEAPVLRVLQSGLLDLVVDCGRFRAGRFGLARSGPLDARSAWIANRLVGNQPQLALLEFNLQGPELEVLADTVLAFAGWGVSPLLDGQPLAPFSSFAVRRGSILRFPPQPLGARGYLAVAGGIQSGTFLGSRATDVRGLIGRPLRAGDRLGSARPQRVRPGFAFRPWPEPGYRGVVQLRIFPGPQATREALAELAGTLFTVLQADRMGVRFSGRKVPGGSVTSEANPLGALQVTPGGQPLLLLHDRGTLGGYAKPAVVVPQDLWRAGQLKVGNRVRFAVGRI